MEARDVTEHLLQRASWGASRSSGPGGQHRDKASTRAELILDGEALLGLPSQHAERLAARLGLDERPLRILSQAERSLPRNREVAAARLGALVAEALAPDPPQRRPTLPTRTAREKRLASKTRRGTVKRLRQRPADD
jgi:ribosome-associated protein